MTRARQLLSGWLAFLTIALAYLLAGKLGLEFAFVHANATPLWPPTGIALAALLLGGYRLWPAIFIAAFVVNVTTAGSVATSVGIAAGNTAEALIGVFLVRRFANGRRAFALPRTIFVFVLVAGFIATTVSATIGVVSLVLGGYGAWPNVGPIWLTWWLGDAAGALMIAPFIIVWANDPRFTESRARWAEAVGVGLVMVAVAMVVFGVGAPIGVPDAPLSFLCFPPLVWAAYRFGPRGAVTALVMLAAIAAAGTLRGRGPFAVASPNESLLVLQSFLVTTSVMVLPLAALAEELMRRAATSAENERLYRESERMRRTAEAFAESGRALVQSLDMRAVADRIVSSVRELLAGTTAIVFERDPATGSHTALSTSGDGGAEFIGVTIPAGAGAIGLAVRDRRPIVTSDVMVDPRITLPPEVRRRVGRTPMRAVVAVPLMAQGDAIGAFLVGDRAGRLFTTEETMVAEAFAHHAALAIGNARLYEEAQRARRAAEAASQRAAFLADASVIVGSTLDDEAVLARFAELAVPRTADWAAVFIEDQGPIRCVAFHHQDAAKTERGRRYIAAQPIDINAPHGVGKVIRTGTSDLVPDVSDEMIRAVARDEEGLRIRIELGHRSIMAVPLPIDDSQRGALVFGRGTPNAYDGTDLALAEDLGRRVALAMQNARLYRAARDAREHAERARWQAAFLAETSRLLASSLDYDATLDTLIRHAVPTLADWVVVHIEHRDGSVRRIGPAYADPTLAPLAEEIRRVTPSLQLAPQGRSVTAEVVRTGRPLLVSELSREWIERATPDRMYREFIFRLNPQSMVIVPLIARGETLGSLTFVSLTPDRRYGETDLAFAEEIGRRAGVAIDNARLYRQTEEARAEAEEANRAKDEFLAVLSHELRTPLNSIAGWLSMFQAGTLEGIQVERALASVGRNVSVLRRLIEDLLDVSRIVAGKLTLEPSPCDFATIVEQTIESFAREAAAREVQINADLRPSVVVEADALRLRQIVSNLVSNALKFTPAGGGVFVTLHARDRAVLTVADTGSGVPSDVLPHIFERFRQGDSTSTRRHGGLGLGLAIVKHLVELHGGTVRAENHPETHGAIFTVELPIET